MTQNGVSPSVPTNGESSHGDETAVAEPSGFVFNSEYVCSFMKNKHVVFIGDSVQRGFYKDLVLYLQSDRLLSNDKTELKEKGEATFLGDRLLFRTELTNGTEFTEVREYQSPDGCHLVQYYFVTRCYNERVAKIIEEFAAEPPDVIVMNSCLWDISRYGETSEDEYAENMCTLLSRLREVLPPSSMFIWAATLPLASHIGSGFLLNELKFMEGTLRVAILEANWYVAQIVASFGFDVLDLHYYLRSQLAQRELDGVHWNETAHRHMTELIITFLHDSWLMPVPDLAVQRFNMTDLKMDLKHFVHDGTPSFAEHSLKQLGAMADALQAAKEPAPPTEKTKRKKKKSLPQ